MKQEIEKYLKSQEELNLQTIKIRKFGMKLCKVMIVIILIGIIAGVIGAIFSI